APVNLFISDLQSPVYQVSHVMLDDQEFMRGLPVLHVGTWNNTEFTADDLRNMASNFARIQQADSYEPALKTRHTYDWETMKPENVDAGDVTQGWWVGLRYDELTQALVGDVRVVDWGLVDGMTSGKLRYLSAEVLDGYTTADGTKIKGPIFGGAAWVDFPAVKGMPWELVMNAQDFSALRADGRDRQDNDGDDGDNMAGHRSPPYNGTSRGEGHMTIRERIKAMFAGKVPEADLKQVDQLKGDLDGEMPGGDGTNPTGGDAPAAPAAPATGDAPAAGEPATGADAELVAQLAQMRKTTEEQAAQISLLRSHNIEQDASRRVDELVSGGHLPPAQRATTYAMIHTALTTGAKVRMLRATGEGEQRTETMADVPMADAIAENIRGMGYHKLFAQGPGLQFVGSENPHEPQSVDDKRLDAIAEQTGGKAQSR
ncbi:MAG TPA: hypothetical protein VM487_01290, partial [Phycisphaerae bacterium]|nr:hypothetical protein [Phycisphaerae bacterium]